MKVEILITIPRPRQRLSSDRFVIELIMSCEGFETMRGTLLHDYAVCQGE